MLFLLLLLCKLAANWGKEPRVAIRKPNPSRSAHTANTAIIADSAPPPTTTPPTPSHDCHADRRRLQKPDTEQVNHPPQPRIRLPCLVDCKRPALQFNDHKSNVNRPCLVPASTDSASSRGSYPTILSVDSAQCNSNWKEATFYNQQKEIF